MAKIYMKRRRCSCLSNSIKRRIGQLVVLSDRIFFKDDEVPVSDRFISNTKQITIDAYSMNDLHNSIKVSRYPKLNAAEVSAEVGVIIDGLDYHLSTSFEYTEKKRIHQEKPYYMVNEISLSGVTTNNRRTNTVVSHETCMKIIDALMKVLTDEKII